MEKIAPQTLNNATTWVGQFGEQDETKGQTFLAPKDGKLQQIEVFPNIITKKGHLTLSLHNYNLETKKWGAPLQTTKIEVSRNDQGRWLSIHLDPTFLKGGESYGFKIDSDDSFIGIGEGAGSHANPPYKHGGEWSFGKHPDTDFKYFSLAFKLGLTA